MEAGPSALEKAALGKGQSLLGGGLSGWNYTYFHDFFLFGTEIYSEEFFSGRNFESTKLYGYIFKIISKCY